MIRVICYNQIMIKNVLIVGAVLDGLMIIANQHFGWSGGLNYLLGGLAVLWGIFVFKNKS